MHLSVDGRVQHRAKHYRQYVVCFNAVCVFPPFAPLGNLVRRNGQPTPIDSFLPREQAQTHLSASPLFDKGRQNFWPFHESWRCGDVRLDPGIDGGRAAGILENELDLDPTALTSPCQRTGYERLGRDPGSLVGDVSSTVDAVGFRGGFDGLSGRDGGDFVGQLGGFHALEGIVGGFNGNVGGGSGQIKTVEQASDSEEGKNRLSLGPESAGSRAVRGLPLGAKIGAAIILTFCAWGVIFRSWDRFDGFNGRERNRRVALGLFLAGLGLAGLSLALWAWAFGPGPQAFRSFTYPLRGLPG